jgi:tripartite-type tricarboxylate transporter receptor subunit TctC
MTTRRTFLRYGGAAAATAVGISGGWAQQSVTRVVTPYAVGGGADILARLLTDHILKSDGPTYIVEPRPGASARIAINVVSSAAPDGKTLLLSNSSVFTLAPHTFKDPKEQVLTSLQPVASLSSLNFVLFVNDAVPAKTISEYLALTKSDPKFQFYAMSGAGTITHFLGVMLASAIKVPLKDVAYQGSAPVLTAVVGNHVPAGISSISPALIQSHNDKRIRILATMSAKRSTFLPDVPTMTEAGIPEIAISDWSGVWAPPGTPASVIDPIYSLIAEVTKQQSFIDGLKRVGQEPVPANPAECAAMMQKDYATWGPIVQASGFKEN